MARSAEQQVLPHDRKQVILDFLLGNDSLSVSDAVRLLQASPATVRRDFTALSREGSLRRVRGGVTSADKRPQAEITPFSLRAVEHSAEKRAIAMAAAELLRPDDAVIIEGGTTTSCIAEFLPRFPLRIITNSVRLATLLEEHRTRIKDVETYVVGGILYSRTGLLLGPSAEAGIRQYHAQWLFLSTGGITSEGIWTTNEMVMEIERAMIASAEKIAILADLSKLGRKALCRVCSLDEVDVVITNPCEEQRELVDLLRSRGVRVIETSSATDAQTAPGTVKSFVDEFRADL